MRAALRFILRAVAAARGVLVFGGFNPLRGATTGVVMRLRAASGEDGTRGFGFLWGLLRCWGGGFGVSHGRFEAELFRGIVSAELGNDIGLMGALLPFVLRAVAGACVGRWTGQPRMPPQERLHEGL